MRGLLLILFLAILVCAVYIIVTVWKRTLRARAEWQVRIRYNGRVAEIGLVRRGDPYEPFATLDMDDLDYQDQLAFAMSQAEEKVLTRNCHRKALLTYV